MSALADAPHVEADDRATWRAWLEANHASSSGAWLVTWRPSSGRQSLDYEAAVEEALCFGWVDSTGARIDDERGKLYFAPRKPGSGWRLRSRFETYRAGSWPPRSRSWGRTRFTRPEPRQPTA